MKYTHLFAGILFLSTHLNAQSIVTDRPDQTESALCVPKNVLQFETGVSVQFEDLDGGSIQGLVLPGTLFRYGLGGPVEFRVYHQLVSEGVNSDTRFGIADLELGLKFKLFRSASEKTNLALLTQVLLPSGSGFLSNDKYGSLNKLCVSHQITESNSLSYNVGYNYFGKGKGDLTYSLSLGAAISEKAALYVEPFGAFEEMDEFILNVDAGFTYLLKSNMQLDFSWGTGIQRKMNYLAIGFSWKSGG
ncbi:MAG: transporter [Saprospiraceae bacterium]|nr:transporter [Saprospiraceae bacterium]